MKLQSNAVRNGGHLPPRYSARGGNLSPDFEWSPVPKAAAYSLVIRDVSVRPSFYHWIVSNIPAGVTSLKTGTRLYSQGVNSAGRVGYIGPYPPAGQTHLYAVTVKAHDSHGQTIATATMKMLFP